MERDDSVRRAGILTLGVTLVAAGTVMLAALLWPSLDLRWVLKTSPLMLIGLGAEVLAAARKGGRVRYDWVGMALCVLVTAASLCLTAAAWWLLYGPAAGGAF